MSEPSTSTGVAHRAGASPLTADWPALSVIVCCRNEAGVIGRCLDSLTESDYPKERLEILVVDGRSEDESPAIIDRYAQRYPYIRRLDNAKRRATFAMNIGVRAARGEMIALLGAHARYPADYLTRCVRGLLEHPVDNVGGNLQTLPRNNSLMAQAIAIALSHPFGAGSARFRAGVHEPRLVDTVFGGCFRRAIFERIGLFNEELPRSQDMEFNIRLRQAGGRILQLPDIACTYYARSNFWDYVTHVFDDGKWVIYPLQFGAPLFYPRHLLPMLFVMALGGGLLLALGWRPAGYIGAGGLGLYGLASLVSSADVARQRRDPRYLAVMPLTFGGRHFAHGLGAFYGLLRSLVVRRFWQNIIQRLRALSGSKERAGKSPRTLNRG